MAEIQAHYRPLLPAPPGGTLNVRALRKNMAWSSDQLAMKCVSARSSALGFPSCPWRDGLSLDGADVKLSPLRCLTCCDRVTQWMMAQDIGHIMPY